MPNLAPLDPSDERSSCFNCGPPGPARQRSSPSESNDWIEDGINQSYIVLIVIVIYIYSIQCIQYAFNIFCFSVALDPDSPEFSVNFKFLAPATG